MSAVDVSGATLAWLRASVADPSRRLPPHLPERPGFGAAGPAIRAVAAGALPDVEIGGILLLGPAGVEARIDLTWLAHYPPVVDGLPFLGTFHVHPKGHAPTFAPEDLAHILRSDNPGFVDLLATPEKQICLVRTNPFLYVAADRVDRDPLVLAGRHEEYRRALGARARADADDARPYRAATLALCRVYRIACYEGPAGAGILDRVLLPG